MESGFGRHLIAKQHTMITIPNPCHEDWNKMNPQEKGRLCDKCCKVVVDFREKTTEQILGFFKEKIGQKVCGRFKAEQVQPALVPVRINRTRTFLAALVLVFGGLLFNSCKEGSLSGRGVVMGEMVADTSIYGNGQPFSADTINQKGKTAAEKKACEQKIEIEMMGDVAFDPSHDTIK
jgi:hypothetical protein